MSDDMNVHETFSGSRNMVARLSEGKAKRDVWELTHLAIDAEFYRAHSKHNGRTPANPNVEDGECLAILVEEVGEVAHAITYDSGEGLPELYDELIQVATMAAAWSVQVRNRINTYAEADLDAGLEARNVPGGVGT